MNKEEALQKEIEDLRQAMELIRQPIDDAYDNAVHLAIEYGKTVEFEYNGTKYKITRPRLGAKVERQKKEIDRLREFIGRLTDPKWPYRYLDGLTVVNDARDVLKENDN